MKKSFKKICKKTPVYLFASLCVFFLLSCGEDSGLGASVDTEAPKLEITYPPLGSVIKEDFILAGTCSDDKEVSSVIVKVTNSSTKALVDEVKAIVQNNKNWYISLNPKTSDSNEWGNPVYKYADGTYQISAIAYDGAGHSSGEFSRSVEIDNTPPLFLISSPQIDDLNDVTNYGTKLKIVGTVADSHMDHIQMKVLVRDEAGNIVANSESDPITVNNISTAGGTSETIASYSKGANSGKYVEIYFDNGSGGINLDQTGTKNTAVKSL